MSTLPLSRYRVVDLGTAWAGPMATQLLADMGAEVIKVESRARLDGLRLGRPLVGEDIAGGDQGVWPELQPLFHSLNRNKLSVTLNLKTEEGVGLAKELVACSDVVLSNFSPGVLGRMGLDYESLRSVSPDIILVSMPSVGETGPLRDILAYAPIIQALSGLMSLVDTRRTSPWWANCNHRGAMRCRRFMPLWPRWPLSAIAAALARVRWWRWPNWRRPPLCWEKRFSIIR